MEAGGSFLELACIRIAIVPVGQMSDARFLELANQIDVVNELPSNALPKPQTNPRRTFLGGMSAMAATFSHAPPEFRAAQQLADGISPVGTATQASLTRSRSAARDNSMPRRTHSLSPLRINPSSATSASNIRPALSSNVSMTSTESSPTSSIGPSSFGVTAAPAASGATIGALSHTASTSSVPATTNGPVLAAPSSAQPSASSAAAPFSRPAIGAGTTTENISSAASGLTSRLLSSTPFGTDRFAQTLTPQRRRWTNISSVDGEAGHVRLKYDIIHRDSSGSMIIKPPSEWDTFHSRRIWGVIGVVDCTDPDSSASTELVDKAIAQARSEFTAALGYFRGVSVSRLMVFTTSDAVRESGTFVTEVTAPHVLASVSGQGGPLSANNTGFSQQLGSTALVSTSSARSGAANTAFSSIGSPLGLPSTAGDAVSRPIMVGYIPIASSLETRLEVRAQIIHFVGLVLSSLETWMQHESITSDVFLSPLDEHNAADNKSKLEKRRQGRLDKIQGDYYLMTGFASEALTRFNSAIERAKANSDSLWLAGAMEGAVAAQVYIHVTAGNAADDTVLIDKVMEQYDEVFKLYRKKRVAELEAGSALRLAEYLGRWTNRRKEAIESANQASNVGRELRSTKRQSLWEALARFFEAMGCRRKAALYLYRLGQLDASQDLWSKAVTLITASARQFSHARNSGSWPSLHRRVLLEAAAACREARDPVDAARHTVEALALSPNALLPTTESDFDVLRTLLDGPVPTVIPHADKLVDLNDLSAQQLSTLSIRTYEQGRSTVACRSGSITRAGPFIYNPFEARRVAAIEAEASRAVTWICGETAHVSLCLKNRLQTPLSIEIIAVGVYAAENEQQDIWPPMNALRNHGDEMGSGKRLLGLPLLGDDSIDAPQLRAALRTMSKSVSTVSQTVVLPSRSSGGSATIDVSVVPRRAGSMRLHGVVLRLFSGCIVTLSAQDILKGGKPLAIEVMQPLPRLSLSVQPHGFDSQQYLAIGPPISLLEGEHRLLRILISNSGPDDISNAVIQTRSDAPDRICLVPAGQPHRTDIANLDRGQSTFADFVVYATRPHPTKNASPSKLDGHTHTSAGAMSVVKSSVFVDVEYIGRQYTSHYRTTSVSVNVVVAPAVFVEQLSLFPDTSTIDGGTLDGLNSRQRLDFGTSLAVGLMAEVANHASATLEVWFEDGCVGHDGYSVLPPVSDKDRNGHCERHGQCLIEKGGSARLVSSRHGRLVVDKASNEKSVRAGLTKICFEGPEYAIHWLIPATGRRGAVPVYRSEVQTASLKQSSECGMDQATLRTFSWYSYALSNIIASIAMSIVDDKFSTPSIYSPGPTLDTASSSIGFPGGSPCVHASVVTRRYYNLHVSVQNTSAIILPASASLDLQLCQRDCRGGLTLVPTGLFVGCHEGIACGTLAPGDVFNHVVKLRLSSAGFYDLVATLHEHEFPGISSEVYERVTGARDSILDFNYISTPLSAHLSSPANIAAIAEVNGSNFASGSPQLPNTLSGTPPLGPDASGTAGQSSTESLVSPIKVRSPEMSKSFLRRVGLTRKKKMDDTKLPCSPRGIASASIRAIPIVPTEGELYPLERMPRRISPPLCAATYTLQAFDDFRCSSGILRHARNPLVDMTGEARDTLDSMEQATGPHHGPDTIVH